ncbi:UNKNOWN [Stylonychia lemnae]|uniref:Uncharacterized protein n=1 Tax=Stylonychia lemnae TaxID=5949 RepID=A0A077ZYZ3_STYLE|nr:UNKNOWN [Stylonychia lemnae]|eukprot:CDW74398.1 UNKNOWN [Stylonychia lemnae]
MIPIQNRGFIGNQLKVENFNRLDSLLKYHIVGGACGTAYSRPDCQEPEVQYYLTGGACGMQNSPPDCKEPWIPDFPPFTPKVQMKPPVFCAGYNCDKILNSQNDGNFYIRENLYVQSPIQDKWNTQQKVDDCIPGDCGSRDGVYHPYKYFMNGYK